MASFYRVGKPFSCIDGSASIPWTKVNDDYCDCLDGSDEPGTPACRRGVFHCNDIQYKLVSVPTAYVKDGYCDCCDGSDEYGFGASCESTCGVLAAASQQAKAAKRAELEQGHKMYKEQAELLKIKMAKEEQERASAEEEARLAAEKEASMEPPQESQPVLETEADNITETSNSNESVEDVDGTGDSSSAHVPLVEDAESDTEKAVDTPDHAEEPETQPEYEAKNETKDYGPDNIFRVLDDMDECLKLSVQQYTYELCGLKEVYQNENGNRVSLGRWAGWGHSNEDENKYTTMLFKNGLMCWNGPHRSTKVLVHCGPKNELVSVSEPSRCEYEMHLVTYAACHESPDVLFKRLHPDEL